MSAAALPPGASIATSLAAGGVSILLGGALLLWGRKAGRFILAMAAAGAAAAAAPLIARHLPYKNVWAIGLSAAFTAGLLFFLLGRILWSLVLAALAGAAGAAIVAWFSAGAVAEPPAWTEHDWGGWPELIGRLVDYSFRWLAVLWGHNAIAVALAAGLPALAAIVLGLLCPQVMLMLVTSIVGGAAAVSGIALLVWAAQPDWAHGWIERIHIPLAVAGLLAATGLIVQARGKLREMAQVRQREAAGPEEHPQAAGRSEEKGSAS